MSDILEDQGLTEQEKGFNAIDVEKVTKELLGNKELRIEYEEVDSNEEPVDTNRMQDSSLYPNVPVAPSLLATKVTEQLEKFGNVVPSKTPAMVEELCRSFNECIRLNINKEKTQTLILSPKTGSAKSVSSKMYVSLLQAQATIIVVYTIEDALETCKDINEWSEDNDYARCYYSISKDNPDSPERVEKKQLSRYRCIVISHALFKLANTKEDIDYLSIYNGSKREFVLIDERVDLYKTITFPLVNLVHLSKLFNDIKQGLELDYISQETAYLSELQESFTDIQQQVEITLDIPKDKVTKSMQPKKFLYINAELYKENNLKSFDFNNFYKLLDTKKINLQRIIDPLSLTGSDLNGTMVESLKILLNNLSTILKHKFYYFSYSSTYNSSVIMVTKNILNSFGSHVVLDATATVNQLYVDKVESNPETVKHIATTNPRRYNNCTIYECRGISQGKSNIYKEIPTKELEVSIDIYVNIANSLLVKDTDKLLIIAHKDFKEMLQKKISSKAVEFTHWGNHRGKNNWNNCNKVLVIGWNYTPVEVYYENYLNAQNGLTFIHNDEFSQQRKYYEITQIADDLVQGVNRGAVRKTVSTEGDCVESEIYLFYPNTIFGKLVLEQFKSEFIGANRISWQPEGIATLQELTKAYANIEILVEYIENKVNELGEIKESVVRKYFNDETNPERLGQNIDKISSSAVGRYIKDNPEFTILLNSKGIQRIPSNLKSFKYVKTTL